MTFWNSPRPHTVCFYHFSYSLPIWFEFGQLNFCKKFALFVSFPVKRWFFPKRNSSEQENEKASDAQENSPNSTTLNLLIKLRQNCPSADEFPQFDMDEECENFLKFLTLVNKL